MDEHSHALNQGFAKLQRLMGELVQTLAAAVLALPATRPVPPAGAPAPARLKVGLVLAPAG